LNKSEKKAMKNDKLEKKFRKLKDLIIRHKKFFLIIHPNPDSDALGSSFALQKYIESFPEKKTKIYCLNQPEKNLIELFSAKKKITTTPNIKNQDVIIILDRGDVFYKLKFDTKITKETSTSPKIINIDHHPRTKIKEAINIRDTKAAATSEIIFRFFKHIKFPLNQEIAQFLLNGIYADTGGFRHSNTTPLTLEITGQLMQQGASISKVNRALFANKSLSTLKLWGIALDRVKINKKTGMAVSFITQRDLKKCGATPKDLDGLAEIINTISDAKFSLVLTEQENNKVKASLRSEKYKKIDVSKIARLFKGGGHKLASGFEIEGRLKKTKRGWIVE